MSAIVSLDAQGFAGRSGEFIIKELAFCSDSRGEVKRYFLKPPYSLEELPGFRKKGVSFCTHRIHGLSWTEGELSYETAKTSISADLSVLQGPLAFYCKGHDKARALSEFLGMTVSNVEDVLEEASFHTQYVYLADNARDCHVHNELKCYMKCAVREAYTLRVLLQSFFSPAESSRLRVASIDVSAIDDRIRTFNQNCLHDSPVAKHLAKIGYYCIGNVLYCYFCKASVSDWEENCCVKPCNIPHFNHVCPLKNIKG